MLIGFHKSNCIKSLLKVLEWKCQGLNVVFVLALLVDMVDMVDMADMADMADMVDMVDMDIPIIITIPIITTTITAIPIIIITTTTITDQVMAIGKLRLTSDECIISKSLIYEYYKIIIWCCSKLLFSNIIHIKKIKNIS